MDEFCDAIVFEISIKVQAGDRWLLPMVCRRFRDALRGGQSRLHGMVGRQRPLEYVLKGDYSPGTIRMVMDKPSNSWKHVALKAATAGDLDILTRLHDKKRISVELAMDIVWNALRECHVEIVDYMKECHPDIFEFHPDIAESMCYMMYSNAACGGATSLEWLKTFNIKIEKMALFRICMSSMKAARWFMLQWPTLRQEEVFESYAYRFCIQMTPDVYDAISSFYGLDLNKVHFLRQVLRSDNTLLFRHVFSLCTDREKYDLKNSIYCAGPPWINCIQYVFLRSNGFIIEPLDLKREIFRQGMISDYFVDIFPDASDWRHILAFMSEYKVGTSDQQLLLEERFRGETFDAFSISGFIVSKLDIDRLMIFGGVITSNTFQDALLLTSHVQHVRRIWSSMSDTERDKCRDHNPIRISCDIDLLRFVIDDIGIAAQRLEIVFDTDWMTPELIKYVVQKGLAKQEDVSKFLVQF